MVDKKTFEKFNKGVAKIKFVEKQLNIGIFKSSFLGKIFEKVNINITKIKVIKKKN